MIGGALARPCISYPTLFEQGTIWDRFPYLLPNLFSALIVVVGVVNGILFLEETHSEKRMKRDRGLEVGRWILSKVSKCTEVRDEKTKLAEMEETRPLISHDEEQLPGYCTAENSPISSPRLQTAPVSESPAEDLRLDGGQTNIKGTNKTFTKPVILNIVSFGILAL